MHHFTLRNFRINESVVFRFFYTLFFILILPFIFARLWWKEKKVPGYRIRWLQRFGVFKTHKHTLKPIWIHAVSVGEFIASIPLIRALLARGDVHIMVTTMTPTGSDRVIATFGNQVEHVYAPYDLPWTTSAFLKRFQPKVVIIMETELWPNMIASCAKRGLPIVLANARLSKRSAAKYARFPKTTKAIFNMLSHVAAQSDADGKRYIELGLISNKVTTTGNIKFDLRIPNDLIKEAHKLKQQYSQSGKKSVWIAASTHDDEEKKILRVFARLSQSHTNLLLILVPRHPERFDEILELANREFTTCLRSSGQVPDASTQVLIGDTMGEMLLLYGTADIAFVGGSLIERGGHNMIEAAAWGLPILCGPHTFNFFDIAERLEANGGMKTVDDGEALFQHMQRWLNTPEIYHKIGQHAYSFAEGNRGGIRKLLTTLDAYL